MKTIATQNIVSRTLFRAYTLSLTHFALFVVYVHLAIEFPIHSTLPCYCTRIASAVRVQVWLHNTMLVVLIFCFVFTAIAYTYIITIHISCLTCLSNINTLTWLWFLLLLLLQLLLLLIHIAQCVMYILFTYLWKGSIIFLSRCNFFLPWFSWIA